MKQKQISILAIAFALAAAACSDAGGPTGQSARAPEAATMVAVAAGSQAATVGTTVAAAPAVRVADASGRPVAGATVRFVVIGGGGSVASANAATGADGVASAGAWTLGRQAGENVLEAQLEGVPAVRFTARAAADVAARLFVAAGDAQQATVNTRVPVSPAVVARDRFGNPVSGVAVTFSVAAGGGTVQGGTATTDGSGTATVGAWTLGASAGTNILSASAAGAQGASFTATALASTSASVGNYDITVRYVSAATARQQQAVEAAVLRWRTVITGELQDIPLNVKAGSCFSTQPAVNEVVDDLLLFVDFSDIDGPGKVLGHAGPCYIRTGNGLPIVGHLALDRADLQLMESSGTLNDVVLHEVGHVLGIGTLWSHQNLLSGAGTSDPFFIGARAIDSYRAAGGAGATSVPVENTGGEGTRDGHWRESVFGNELMTGYISGSTNPLSAITIGSLIDLGYNGNLSAGNGYTVGGGSGSGLRLGEGETLHRAKFRVDRAGRVEPIP